MILSNTILSVHTLTPTFITTQNKQVICVIKSSGPSMEPSETPQQHFNCSELKPYNYKAYNFVSATNIFGPRT